MIRCPRSGNAGARIPLVTPKALLTSEALRRLDGRDYLFCPAPDCDVVYFDREVGTVFLKDDLTVRVGIKESEDPIPICYCFGVSESDLRQDLSDRRESAISLEIAANVRSGRCACKVRNPEGVCCLGRISRAVERIRAAAAG